MKYRAEIDGLRAIAVLSVILFHGGIEYFSGGFVGVDVFFVISGYLITTIILSEKENGTFSLINFYDRRARRILPALFFVMFVSIFFAWLWMLPSDMKDFSQSLIAVSLFSSNILFWQETGYWGVANELKPLLHTWSLAVEEQYYFLFPLFLMLMWRFRKRWILASFIIIALISLMLSQWAAYHYPSANFFLLITRGWELAIGACIAFYFLYRKPIINTLLSNKKIDELLSLLGLLLISYSVLRFDESLPFPSLYALVPTIGTGLIIMFANQQTFVGRILGTKVLVKIGLISYSAYLWHQPLFAFARHRVLTEPSQELIYGLIFMTFILAYLSWRYIEKPFRSKNSISRKAVFTFWVIGSFIFISFGIAGHLTNGFNGLAFKNELTQNIIDDKMKKSLGLSNKCSSTTNLSPECRTSNEPEILIWGDSFAMHLVKGVLASNPEAKIAQLTKSACGPFFDVTPVTPKYPISWANKCLKFNEGVKHWIKNNNSIKFVVLSSPFSQYFTKGNKLLLSDGKLRELSFDIVKEKFEKTLYTLREMGVEPVVFSPTPSSGVDLGRCLAKAKWMGLNLNKCDFKVSQMTEIRKQVFHFLEGIEKEFSVVRLDKLICDDTICKTHIGSTWIFRDKGHFSLEGSAAVGKQYDFYSRIVGAD